jgi:hypothetical protein
MLAEADIPADAPTSLWEEAFGWPQPALKSRLEESPRLAYPRVIDGIVLTPRRGFGMGATLPYLPTRPIWRGFIIDSVIAAMGWWMIFLLLLAGLRSLRRLPAALRRRRGRCPQCGYDLRGNFDAGCSECGWRRHAASSGVTSGKPVDKLPPG